MTSPFQKIGVVGAGAWGTALAQAARFAGRDVVLYAREKDLAAAISSQHVNGSYLPKIKLDPAITATADLAALSACEALLIVTPTQHIRALCEPLKNLPASVPLVICSKGIEISSGKLLSELVAELLPQRPLAVLSGPTFASEVAQGLPAAVAIASKDAVLATQLCETLGSRSFRPYFSPDVIGVQIGGAIKNVLAIGCGIVLGRGLGENARAALIARGLAEMLPLAMALGGKRETLMGLSGLGDLVLTCSSSQSRNMSLGLALGQGRKLEAILAERHTVAEGVSTAKAAVALARDHKIEMPLVEAVYAILHEKADISSTIEKLMSRPFRAED
jgi:glycerol-3-phosphate dehydrogenase (NAD(P)+)